MKRKLLSKYGRREKDRTVQAIHRITKRIVNHAKANGQAIVMENLKGIRKLYRKGNGQGTPFRGRMNSWMFHEIQRQTDYKARWEGNPVYYVNPRGTSRKCPDCGSSLIELEGRRLWCPSCDKTEDRDVVASKNLAACAVPQARPGG
jgi:putative transposase